MSLKLKIATLYLSLLALGLLIYGLINAPHQVLIILRTIAVFIMTVWSLVVVAEEWLL